MHETYEPVILQITITRVIFIAVLVYQTEPPYNKPHMNNYQCNILISHSSNSCFKESNGTFHFNKNVIR